MFEKRSQPGAPLRNRTVDLLLTMHNCPGSLPGSGVGTQLHPAGRLLLLWPATGAEGCGYETWPVSG
jgi:hypothetical protein